MSMIFICKTIVIMKLNHKLNEDDNILYSPNINRDMMRDFTKPKRPTKTIAKNPYYRDVEEVSAEELSKDKVRFNKIPKGYDGECYVIFLDDMLSFSGLGDFNPKGKNTQHYQVVKCDNVKDAQTVAKNGSRDEMRLLGISCDMPKFRKTASFSIKNAEDCPLWLNETVNKRNLNRIVESVVKRTIKNILKESDQTDEQWKNELKAFMNGLRRGDAIIEDNVIYVQIWKSRTASNDPRYVYFKRGGNRLYDDHFYMKQSPRLSQRTINTINKRAGWSDEDEEYY